MASEEMRSLADKLRAEGELNMHSNGAASVFFAQYTKLTVINPNSV